VIGHATAGNVESGAVRYRQAKKRFAEHQRAVALKPPRLHRDVTLIVVVCYDAVVLAFSAEPKHAVRRHRSLCIDAAGSRCSKRRSDHVLLFVPVSVRVDAGDSDARLAHTPALQRFVREADQIEDALPRQLREHLTQWNVVGQVHDAKRTRDQEQEGLVRLRAALRGCDPAPDRLTVHGGLDDRLHVLLARQFGRDVSTTV